MNRINLWRSGAWLLVAALLLAQQLGVMHRITHSPGSTSAAATSQPAATPATIDAAGWVADLFSGHGEAGCRLFDAHGQGAAPAVPMLALPAAMAVAVVRFFRLAIVSVSPAPFEARAPPFLR